jgi:NAD+ synthase
MLLGYSTIYGDLAYALNPLGDLFKTQVWALSTYLGVPETVVSKVPTADLWEGQSDEAELGFTYAEVDALLFHLVDQRCTRGELEEMGFGTRLIDDVMRRVRNSQYKRRPPLIAKLGPRTIDRDFRYPRDWGR